MKSIKKLKAAFAVLMAMLLTLSPLTSRAAGFNGNLNSKGFSVSVKESAAIPPGEKVNLEVKNALNSQRYVEVLVSMTEQVDTQRVARETKASLSSKTPYNQKMEGRYAVVDSLKETAEKTQRNIISILEAEKSKGNVVEYKSFYVVNMIYVKATKDVINKISLKNEVKEITLNKKIQVEWPKISSASVNNNNIQSVEWGIERVGAPAVWSGFGIDGSGVVVGVIDTGFDYTHEAIKEKWRGYNASTPSQPNPVGNWFDAVSGQTLPYDIPEIPHGTHVTGTILGQDPDGENVIGVAPGAKFILAKAFTADGGEDSWLLAAGQWMLAPNGNPDLAPDIINNSWGGGPGLDEWYRQMVQNWRAAGILPIFSAGNQDGAPAPVGSVASPSNYPESFAVAATDINNIRGDFSRRGPAPYAAPNDLKPDISAPGVNVRSSVPGGYQSGWSGTSMAAPHITGTAALLLSYNAALTPDQIENIITSTATPLTDGDYATSPNYGYGYGLVNAFNAVSSIASGIGTIQGKVLKPGVDAEDAVITHEPLTKAYSSILPTITAEVSDNILVGNVETFVKPAGTNYWAVVEMTRIAGDAKSGTYTCNIPGELLTEPGFQYKIRAYDYGQNITETAIQNVDVKFGEIPGQYATDFSQAPMAWSYDNDWQWGETTTGVAPAGNKLMATILNGNYNKSLRSSLVTPPIDMRNTDTATLQLKHWFDFENNYDKGYVAVSNDFGNNWTIVNTFTGRDKTWRDLTINLNSFAHSINPVFVIFQLSSDSSVQYDGWYIDDVNLATNTQPVGKVIEIPTTKATDLIVKKDSKPAAFSGANLKNAKAGSKYYINSNINAQLGLPLDAVVTILETGRSVRTSMDGSYKLTHAATEAGENWTLLVEAYGYHPVQEKVTLDNNQTLVRNYVMTELDKGSVTGQVVNERDNTPIQGATIKLLEDFHVPSVTTDANGYYTIPGIYVGQYTLRISAPNYYTTEKPVTITVNNTSEINAALKPFIGYENEIGYDDGVGENARALYAGGNGWAVRMTPNGMCQVKGAKVFVYDNTWPVPGDNKIKIAVYDSLPNGEAGNEIFRTDVIEAVRGQWNEIDLSSYGFATNKDFYVAVIQIGDYPNCAGIGSDETSSAGRSYSIVDGGFQPLAEDEGNMMIRATVAYALNAPIITSPVTGAFTNMDKLLVTGTVTTDSLVKIYVNNNLAGEAQSSNKAFSIEVPVLEGQNIIKATSVVTAGETDPSLPVTVIRDKVAPVLEVASPVDGLLINKEVVEVTGKALDTYLDYVKVNNEVVPFAADGSFSTKVIVNQGENTINILAADKAGNITNVTRKVIVNLAMPTITELKPNNDVTLREGEVVTISFKSDAIHGNASFRILLPGEQVPTTIPGGYPMQEVSNGYYVGTWKAPANLNVNGARVEVEIVNAASNKTTMIANGKINVIIDKTPPTLNPDLDGNAIGQNIEVTFENNTEWLNSITDVLVDGQSVAGNYVVEPGKITINGSIFNQGRDYQISVRANGYKDAMLVQPVQNIILLTPPVLTPTTINNYYGKGASLTFVDNAEWRGLITDITLNGQSIAGLYSIYEGRIVIRSTAFPGAGTYTVNVKAQGYEDAVVVQVIRPR